MTIELTGGSDKQNAWASKIASQWLSELDTEIANTALRNDPAFGWYADRLQQARAALLSGFGKLTAKQAIDMYTGKISPVRALIAKARER